MKRLIIIAALFAAPALAQVPGSGVIGAGGGTVGGVSGQVGVGGVGRLAPNGNVDAAGTVNGAVRPLDDAAHESARDADDKLSRAAKADARMQAGARVDRGTRCYADRDTVRAYPYDPAYRDGAYYCERTGPAAAAGAKVKVGG